MQKPLREGTRFKNIALLGSAPSSLKLAPYKDEEWMIWGCSPAVYGVAPRCEEWFEVHRYEPGQTWFSPEYCNFLRNFAGPVWVSKVVPEIPHARRVPIEALAQEWGPYMWTSTVAYMLALAIAEKPEAIGLWGIDMAANEEYGRQRPACQYLAYEAARRGIKVVVPPESDLLMPFGPYGFIEQTNHYLKFRARKQELTERRNAAQQGLEHAARDIHFINGSLDDIEYAMEMWGHDRAIAELTIDGMRTGGLKPVGSDGAAG